MHVRLDFLQAIVFVFLVGAFGLQSAGAAFCTIEDIQSGIDDNVPIEIILDVCTELDVDVNKCDVNAIVDLLKSKMPVEDIYLNCQ